MGLALKKEDMADTTNKMNIEDGFKELSRP